MPRARKCECGTCRTCKHRAYQAEYRRKHPDKARAAVRKSFADPEKRKRYRETDRAYQANKPPEVEARYRAYQLKWQRARRHSFNAIVRAAKESPCVDCGTELPPALMDLDHVRGEKLFAVGSHVRHLKGTYAERVQMLKDEIAKCDVRCPNCHRMRHYVDDTDLEMEARILA